MLLPAVFIRHTRDETNISVIASCVSLRVGSRSNTIHAGTSNSVVTH
jgi:hypothetical protein